MNSKHQKLLSKSQLNKKIKNQLNNFLSICNNTTNNCRENDNLSLDEQSCVQSTENNILLEPSLKSTYLHKRTRS